MVRKKNVVPNKPKPKHSSNGKDLHIELLNASQKLAFAAFQQHDVLFLLGPAGCGKTFLAVAFAIKQLLAKEKSKIIMTRPIVEAGESLGFLPGEFEEKVHPYMLPMYDCVDTLFPHDEEGKENVMSKVEVAPLAYMRGRTFNNAVCIFDEAQNATKMQLKMFLTRFGKNSKVVITGDPTQSDIGHNVALVDVVNRLQGVPGIGVVEFKANSIVRHPLVMEIIEKLEA
jgi:phosphate starvation-inducible PhoH-like protein